MLRLAFVACLPGCSDLLGIRELDRRPLGTRDASTTDTAPLREREAGSSAPDAPPTLGVAAFDAYYFARGSAYGVGPGEGVLLNDPPGFELVAGAYRTERAGRVQLRPDGSFDYTPPSPSFWGDDHFEYSGQLAGATAEQQARVRLSIDLGRVVLAELEGGAGNGLAWGGSAVDPGCADTGLVATAAGDVNGDGRDDVVIGTPLASPGGVARAGALAIVFGGDRPVPPSVVPTETGQAGFIVNGAEAGTAIGTWAIGAGDIDGDGLDDLVTGSGYTAAAGIVGVSVVLGKADGSTLLLGANGLQGGRGFGFRGSAVPQSLAAAGDVNGDGRADVIVALPTLDAGSGPAGASVVFGKAGSAAVTLTEIASELGGGFSIVDDLIGSVSGGGDVNGDGLDDLVLGASGAGQAAYVVFGKLDERRVPVSDIRAGRGGFIVAASEPGDNAGEAVAIAPDVNGDGLDDVLLGASLHTNPRGDFNAGAAYVVFGKRDGIGVSLADVENGQGGYFIHGATAADNLGRSLAGLGDVNGDGLGDIAVGAPNAAPADGPATGKAFVVFGKVGVTPVSPAELGSGGFEVLGASAMDFVGKTVARAGDLDADGLADVIVGAPGVDCAGRTYVLYGWDASAALRDRDGFLRGTPAPDQLHWGGGRPIGVDGRRGLDTLHIEAGIELDLRQQSARWASIERIDLHAGDSAVTLDDTALRRLPSREPGESGSRQLLSIEGERGDGVQLFDAAGYTKVDTLAGLDVYARSGAYYGLAISPEIELTLR